ncbi:uncharacterized protein AKAW2_51904A [Aspergillus luchuensis]|uniref:Uncharacterized protein n=1 Tax=Aspergillus kawachii TaxID=1069201 RepID=A0A7R7WEL8_ASPKA|nr:uncharacterized protein AKAW2_51904A [Aspergillus luchuensis]BCS01563.1 hypothetical protein AKAW2_51904A [Aspergillus luchuensis]
MKWIVSRSYNRDALPISIWFLTVDHPSVFPSSLPTPCKSGTSAPDRPAAINSISLLIPPSRIRGSPFVGLDHYFYWILLILNLIFWGAMRRTIDSLDLTWDANDGIGLLLHSVIVIPFIIIQPGWMDDGAVNK